MVARHRLNQDQIRKIEGQMILCCMAEEILAENRLFRCRNMDNTLRCLEEFRRDYMHLFGNIHRYQSHICWCLHSDLLKLRHKLCSILLRYRAVDFHNKDIPRLFLSRRCQY